MKGVYAIVDGQRVCFSVKCELPPGYNQSKSKGLFTTMDTTGHNRLKPLRSFRLSFFCAGINASAIEKAARKRKKKPYFCPPKKTILHPPI